MKKNIFYMAMAALMAVACTETESGTDNSVAVDESQYIKVSGIDASDLITTETTRATNAEDVQWLREPLSTTGIDVTYYLTEQPDDTNEALLKLDTITKDYSFKLYDSNNQVTGLNAYWLGNGGHTFHGLSIPEELTHNDDDGINADDQSLENIDERYTSLTHYLCMPPNHQIQATVSYVRLPFRHRLSRVIAYVLIDPSMKTDLDTITFGNVKVLSRVQDDKPVWKTVKSLLPHYRGRLGSPNKNLGDVKGYENNFVAFRNKDKNAYVFPTSDDWAKLDSDSVYRKAQGYERMEYGVVPSYDVIVRPTYTSTNQVMYDEDLSNTTAEKMAGESNKIDFEVTLKSGLTYTKTFNFDLDANYETVVYLHIDREKVDYSTMGSELWQVQEGTDGPYGLDNASNEHRLSKSGGSWQRAFRIGTDNDPVTDGSEYSQQYITQEAWTDSLKLAVENGKHWGDYFVLTNDIEINVSDWNEIVFAGHLDARGHTITLTGTENRNYLFDGLNGTYEATAGQANVHTENGNLVPKSGYRAEVLNATIVGGSLFKKDAKITGYVDNCKWEETKDETEDGTNDTGADE